MRKNQNSKVIFSMRFLSAGILMLHLAALVMADDLAAPARIRIATDVQMLASPEELAGFGSGIIAVGLAIRGHTEIRLIDLQTAQAFEFNSELNSSSLPNFSPDGNSLTFAGERNGTEKIFVSRWDGMFPRQITTGPSLEGNPSWMPDGKNIVFFSELSPYQRELFRANVDDAPVSVSQIANLGDRNTTPMVSPNGRVVAYSTDRFWPGWDVCFLNLQTQRETCPLGSNNETFCRPSYSPTGDRIVISKGYGAGIDLYLYNPATSVLDRLTNLLFKEYDATFSPSGDAIAFVNDPNGDERYELWLVRIGDKVAIPIARSTGSFRQPSWSIARSYEAAPADQCPSDRRKLVPEICGCGVAEDDSDGDGAADCIDFCPQDSLKTNPGSCGCGRLDLPTSDGTVHCVQSNSSGTSTLRAPRVIEAANNNNRARLVVIARSSSKGTFTFLMQHGSEITKRHSSTGLARFTVSSKRRVRFAWKLNSGPTSSWSRWRRR